jgi:hypothetical protein
MLIFLAFGVEVEVYSVAYSVDYAFVVIDIPDVPLLQQ